MFSKLRDRKSNRLILALILIIGLGVGLRAVSASILSIDGDEGQFIYDSRLVLQGAIPVRDIVPPPDPLYLWILALVELFLGANLFAIRTLSIIFSIVGILGVYFLTGQLASKRVALLASSIYSFSPTVILYNSIGNYRQVAFPIVIIAFYFLIVGIQRYSIRHLLVSGIIIGLAALTYRISAIFLLIVPLLFLMRNQNLKSIAKPVATMIIGTLSALLPVVAFLVSASSLTWVNQVWGFGGGIGSVSEFAVTSQAGQTPFQSLGYYFDFRSRVAFVVAREWLYLILPSILGLIFLLKRSQRRWPLPVKAFLYFGLILFVFMVLRGQSLPPRGPYGTYDTWPGFDYATMALVLAGSLLVVGYPRERRAPLDTRLRDLIVYWTVSLLAVFAIFRILHVFYFIAFASVFSILSAIGVRNLVARIKLPAKIFERQRLIAILILLITLSSAAVSAASVFGTNVIERDLTQNQAVAVGDYIRSHTSPNDEILTGNLIYAVDSGRNNAMKISNPWIYLQGLSDPFPGNPYGSTPGIPVLAAYLSTGSVKYVILDNQLVAMMSQQPQLGMAINSHFVNETRIGIVTISRFSA